MRNIQLTKDFLENLKNLSLKGYYQSLPARIAPKQKMLEDIQSECERVTGNRPTMTTVRNWVLYGIKPKYQIQIKAIADATGLKEENLWKE